MPKVKIKNIGCGANGGSSVEADGKKIDAVTSINYSHEVGCIPTVDIKLVAFDENVIELIDAEVVVCPFLLFDVCRELTHAYRHDDKARVDGLMKHVGLIVGEHIN